MYIQLLIVSDTYTYSLGHEHKQEINIYNTEYHITVNRII